MFAFQDICTLRAKKKTNHRILMEKEDLKAHAHTAS